MLWQSVLRVKVTCVGYLWSLPAHREAWRALAAEDGCRGLYLRFVDVICNDVLHLLDGTLKILPAVSTKASFMSPRHDRYVCAHSKLRDLAQSKPTRQQLCRIDAIPKYGDIITS